MMKQGLLILLAGFLWSCKESEVREQPTSESTAVVEIQQMPLTDGIDWNLELKLLKNQAVLEKAASSAGLEVGELESATKVEIEVEGNLVKIIGSHQDEELAELCALSLAEAYRQARTTKALQMSQDKLDDLDRELALQEEEVAKARESLMKLVEDYQIPSSGVGETLEQDRMTYEKAKAALEEEERGGVLFKKEED
ncbi:MAG: hypothetical protein ACON38_03245 [Akkermansiaceae bacterium]